MELCVTIDAERSLDVVPISAAPSNRVVYLIYCDGRHDILQAFDTVHLANVKKSVEFGTSGLTFKWNIGASPVDGCIYILRRTLHATIIDRTDNTLSVSRWITESVNLSLSPQVTW